jgi:uncharacterized phage protein gp47/JayE
MDAPTRVDLLNIGASYIARTTTKIDPAAPLTDGTDANMFVGSQSVVGDAVVKQIGYSVARLLLDGAKGDDLDRLALDRYGVTRKGASPAVGSVTVSRATLAGGAGSVPVGTVLTTLSGTQYFTTTVATFGASAYQAACNVSASQAGKSTQVGANAITRFLQPGQLFDKTLTATNPLTTAGGEDVEDDDTFRNRVRQFWNTARRGTLAAIEQGALSVPGVVSAMAVEALTGAGIPARVVNLYISDSSGVASQALATQVQVALEDYRAAGIAVIISTSIPLLVGVQLALSYQAGVDTLSLASQVQTAVFNFVNSLGVNATLQVADLNAVLSRFKGVGVIVQTPGSIVSPAGDLVPPVGQTLRTTLGLVTVGAL